MAQQVSIREAYCTWCMQVCFEWSAALGSGLVVVRGEEGDWLPSSALYLKAATIPFTAGGALHDLLIVLRNRQVMLILTLYVCQYNSACTPPLF